MAKKNAIVHLMNPETTDERAACGVQVRTKKRVTSNGPLCRACWAAYKTEVEIKFQLIEEREKQWAEYHEWAQNQIKRLGQ